MHKKTINIEKLLFCLLYLIFMTFVLFRSDKILKLNYEEWLGHSNLLLTVMIITQIIIGKKVFGKLWNLSIILLACTYVFHLSYPILLQIAPNFISIVTYRLRAYDTYTFMKMVTYSIKYISILFMGMLFYELISRKKTAAVIENNEEIMQNTNKVANIMFVIAFPFDFVVLLIRLNALFRGGYLAAYTTAQALKYYSSFFSYLLFCSIFLKWSTTKKESNRIIFLIVYCVYQVLWMFTGQRATALICIILACWLYFGFSKKINFKTILVLLPIAYVVLVILNTIREYRSNGFKNFNFSDIFGGSVIFDAMAEFGVTITIFGRVLTYGQSNNIGYNFIFMILNVIPKVSLLGLDMDKFDIYTALDLKSVGSSFLAEILYDFKQFGYIAVFIYGIFVRWLDTKITLYIENKQYTKAIYYIPLAIVVIFCVRSGTVTLLRTFTWSALLIWFVKKIVFSKSDKNIKFNRRKNEQFNL